MICPLCNNYLKHPLSIFSGICLACQGKTGRMDMSIEESSFSFMRFYRDHLGHLNDIKDPAIV